MVEKDRHEKSWAWRWVANNQLVAALLVVLLILIIIFMTNQVRFIFKPLLSLFSAVGAPIIVAGVFYYLMNPMVDYLEKRWHVQRVLTITGQFIVLVLLIALGVIAVIPWVREQSLSLVHNWPRYWSAVMDVVERITKDDNFKALNQWFDSTNLSVEHAVKSFSKGGSQNISSIFGTVTSFGITLVTFPLILFYLLKDGHHLPKYMAHFLPKRLQGSFIETLTEINMQISNYIRGQLSVALAVAIMFAIGYTVIDLPYGWLIAIAAGFLNLIPFLGSFLAMVPAIVVAIFVSPMMLLYVLIVFAIEQTLEGKVIAPKLLGNSLRIHPVTVVVILLSAGNMFGLFGVVFGIPGYAAGKVLIYRLYQWWQKASDLFEDPVVPSIDSDSE
ncbi:AI-2E family transporter [Weissella diestrammenae]|uniref:AI-2E family transporter n=1 Tax=Weissella diestrammenae TaxID=1162633 RepID=A0A7G9T664_9LACO|nr:AI-2E family transporter [Weissella diestrammenae]MCM0583371.1 AI-2E family transporter [Weissella diestrammenae]QNN75589.1 AI-2E family transporter [Weissella diestrammenae]